MPTAQVQFLKLLDEIGLPHEDAKQLHGSVLEIIGFEVDLLKMSITLPADAKAQLVDAIQHFVHNPPSPRQQTTRAWLRILGYANWGLNVFPLLKPVLNSSYDKVAGHTFMNAPIFLNKRTIEDLLWFADQVELLEGVRMFDNEIWDASEADLQIWGDASAVGLAFWVPLHNVAYIADPIVDAECNFNVFYNEALAILATLQCASSLNPLPKCLAIHTDSSSSFSIFNSLRAASIYNPIIFASVKIHLELKINLHIFFIEGKKNTIADALSRCALPLARHLSPGLKILFFTPPQLSMGASTK